MCLIKHTQKTLAIKTYKLGKQDLGSGCETALSTASALRDSGPEHKALSGLHKNSLHRPWATLSAKPRKHLAEELMQYLPSWPSVTVKVVLQHSIEQRPCCIIQVFCSIAHFPPAGKTNGTFWGDMFLVHYFQFRRAKREKRRSLVCLSNAILKISSWLTFQVGVESYSFFASYFIISWDFPKVLSISPWRFITQSLQFLQELEFSLCDCNQETTSKGKKSIYFLVSCKFSVNKISQDYPCFKRSKSKAIETVAGLGTGH